MDAETIKRINREALDAAKAATGGESESSSEMDRTQMMMYVVAIGVAVGVYFLLQKWQPDFVMSTVNGAKTFDTTRAVIASIVAGLVVVFVYHMSKKY